MDEPNAPEPTSLSSIDVAFMKKASQDYAVRGWAVFPLKWAERGRCASGNSHTLGPKKHMALHIPELLDCLLAAAPSLALGGSGNRRLQATALPTGIDHGRRERS